MDENALLRAIRTARRHLLAEHGDIDPTPQQTHDEVEKLLGDKRSLDRYVQLSWFGDDKSFGTAVTRLVNTPRALKHALRHTRSLWEKLHGEISFDDLLVSMILRFGAGEAFDFLLRRIDSLRMATRDTSSEPSRTAAIKQQEVIQADWDKTIKKHIEWDAEAAQTLIMFLFPHAAKCFGDKCHADFRVSPQGVQNWETTDYWGRMLAGELAPNELHDQTVLKCMREWAESSSASTLVENLCSSDRFVQVWAYFATWVSVPKLLELTGTVLDLVRQRDGAKASVDRNGGAVIALWRRAHDKQVKNDDGSCEWLLTQIERSVPTSLRLANDLYYYWASIEFGIVKAEQDRNLVRERLVDQVKQFFLAGTTAALIAVLDSEYPFSIYHLVHPADQKEPPSILTQPSDWQWLSPILLDAATRSPTHIIPQIVMLVTDSDHDTAWGVHTRWNRAILEGMFGNDLPRLMDILSIEFQMVPVPSDLAAQVKVQNTRELARQWRNENGGESG
jgi:hypothetical protein